MSVPCFCKVCLGPLRRAGDVCSEECAMALRIALDAREEWPASVALGIELPDECPCECHAGNSSIGPHTCCPAKGRGNFPGPSLPFGMPISPLLKGALGE